MAEFPHALKTALDAYYGARGAFRPIASPVSSRRGLTARLSALEKAYGTPKAAAAAAGIHPDTWQRWKRGTRTPAKASADKVEKAHGGIVRALAVKAKGAPAGITIHAVVVCNGPNGKYKNTHNSGPLSNNATSGSGYRPFRADALTDSQRRDVATAYAAGQTPRAVADVLLRAIERQYPEPFSFEGHNVVVEIR